MHFQPQIDKQDIMELPLVGFGGEVMVISSHSEAKKAVRQMQQEKLLGFDTESRPSFKKGQNHPVALIQLASPERAWLFRIALLGKTPELNEILGDNEILKVGLALKEDLRSLSHFCTPNPDSFLDLQEFAPHFGIQEGSLKKLAAIVLRSRISKSQQLSNWENPELSEAQVRYAATDAWVALRIYQTLMGELYDDLRD